MDNVDKLFNDQFGSVPGTGRPSSDDIDELSRAFDDFSPTVDDDEEIRSMVDPDDDSGYIEDLDAYNEEIWAEIEAATEEEKQKKKKLKEKRKKEERDRIRRENEDYNKRQSSSQSYSYDSSQDEDISASERRNKAYRDDDLELDRERQAELQREKINHIREEQRAAEEAARNYQGYGNKNIDFSGKNQHGNDSSSVPAHETHKDQDSYGVTGERKSTHNEESAFRTTENHEQPYHSSSETSSRNEDSREENRTSYSRQESSDYSKANQHRTSTREENYEQHSHKEYEQHSQSKGSEYRESYRTETSGSVERSPESYQPEAERNVYREPSKHDDYQEYRRNEDYKESSKPDYRESFRRGNQETATTPSGESSYRKDYKSSPSSDTHTSDRKETSQSDSYRKDYKEPLKHDDQQTAFRRADTDKHYKSPLNEEHHSDYKQTSTQDDTHRPEARRDYRSNPSKKESETTSAFRAVRDTTHHTEAANGSFRKDASTHTNNGNPSTTSRVDYKSENKDIKTRDQVGGISSSAHSIGNNQSHEGAQTSVSRNYREHYLKKDRPDGSKPGDFKSESQSFQKGEPEQPFRDQKSSFSKSGSLHEGKDMSGNKGDSTQAGTVTGRTTGYKSASERYKTLNDQKGNTGSSPSLFREKESNSKFGELKGSQTINKNSSAIAGAAVIGTGKALRDNFDAVKDLSTGKITGTETVFRAENRAAILREKTLNGSQSRLNIDKSNDRAAVNAGSTLKTNQSTVNNVGSNQGSKATGKLQGVSAKTFMVKNAATQKALNLIKGNSENPVHELNQKPLNINKKNIDNSKKESTFTQARIQNIKQQYAHRLGYSVNSFGKGVGSKALRQVYNSLRENEAIDAAEKTRMGIQGTLAAGSLVSVQYQRMGAAGNAVKSKGHALANAGRYLRGIDNNATLNLKKGIFEPAMKSEFKVVPHSLKQFDKSIKEIEKLGFKNLSDKAIKQQIKLLKQNKNLSFQDKLKLKNLEELLGLREGRAKFVKMRGKAGQARSAISFLASSLMSSPDIASQTMRAGFTSIRYVQKSLKLMKSSIRLASRGTLVAGKQVVKAGKAVNKIKPVNKATTAIRLRVSNSTPVRNLNAGKQQLKGIQKAVTRELHGGMYNRVLNKTPEKVKKVGKGISNTGKVVAKPFKTVNKGFKKVSGGVKKVTKFISAPFRAISKATHFLIGKIAAVAGTFVLIYLFLLIAIQLFTLATGTIFTDTDNLQKYVDSLLVESKVFDGKLDAYRDLGGKKHGKYKNVTVNYVNQNGQQIDSTDNLKEILSMVAVKIENDWPSWYEVIDREKVDGMAIQLFNDSHKISKKEIGPYSCSGCEERDYKCSDPLPPDASAERIRLHELYAERGGCQKYKTQITYYCNDDSAIVDGHRVSNAHSQSWANNYIKTMYNTYYGRGGCQKAHGDNYDSPAPGCDFYTREKYVKHSIQGDSSWPHTAVFSWNRKTSRYEFRNNGSVWYLNLPHTEDNLAFENNNGNYNYYGYKYICKEYTCPGHSTEIERFRCNGHHEVYCPGDHYDLEVNATILHLPALYNADSTSKGVVEQVPENAAEGDFYWDSSNREWCETIFNQDWDDIYEGLVGLQSSVITGEPLTTEQIKAYLDNLPPDLSSDRRKVIETALDAVGKIPYYWGGTAIAPGYELNNFGSPVAPDNKGRDKRGLDCSHFVDWVCWTALGNNLGNGWTGMIWDQSTSRPYNELQPGDIGFQNEGGNSVNHVGFYLGDGTWVHCSGSGNVVVNKTTVFAHYRKLNIMN